MATQQASLALISQTPSISPALQRLAEYASFSRALNAEWLDCTDALWQWEGWGPERALAPIAAKAADLVATANPPPRVAWQPDRAVLTLAGRRPESWCDSLWRLIRLIHAQNDSPIRLRTDGQSVRLLGSEALLRDLSPAIHDLMMDS